MLSSDLIKNAKRFFTLSLGSLLYAVGIGLFLEPNQLAPGGVSGIAIMLSALTGILGTGVWIIILNIPIMAVAMWKFGFRFLISSIYAVALSSVIIDLLVPTGGLTTQPLLACFGGAVFSGAGIGLVFRAGATTGGTDIAVKLLRLKYRHINTGMLFLFIDGVIVICSGFVFSNIDNALYAAIALFVQMRVINAILYGGDEARLVYIISRERDVIAKRLLGELDSGATFLPARGAYTGQASEVLMCVMRRNSLPRARDIVRETDMMAFMIVSPATSVFGEGFKSHDSQDL